MISSMIGFFAKVGLMKIFLFAVPILIVVLAAVCIFSTFNYEIGLFQMVDHSGEENTDAEVESTCANKNGTTRILFLGNSRTYVSNIPDKVRGFAEAAGYSVDITAPDSSTDGGKLLSELFNTKADQLEKSYDCVVMQEQSDTYMYNFSTFLEGATSIVNKVKSVNSNVKTYIRQTWTTSQYIGLDQAYENAEKVASATGSYLIRDGKAFEKSNNDYKNIQLFGDSIHQNANGAYLSAAVIYEMLFGTDVKNSNYTDGINGSDAANLREVASEFAPMSGKGSLTAEQRQKIVEFAKSQEKQHVQYNYNGSWDLDVPGQQLACNGLTYWAYKKAGVDIPRGSVDQMSSGPVVTSHGKISDMSPGDIICYDYAGRVNRPDIDYGSMRYGGYATHHVALYVGDGKSIESSYGGVAYRTLQDYEYSYSITW